MLNICINYNQPSCSTFGSNICLPPVIPPESSFTQHMSPTIPHHPKTIKIKYISTPPPSLITQHLTLPSNTYVLNTQGIQPNPPQNYYRRTPPRRTHHFQNKNKLKIKPTFIRGCSPLFRAKNLHPSNHSPMWAAYRLISFAREFSVVRRRGLATAC